MITVYHGDCREIAPNLGLVDAVVTDPPYGLEFMGKEWDAPWKYGMRAYGMSDTKGRAPGPTFSSSRNPMCKKCRKHQRGNPARRCLCAAPDFDEVEHRLRDVAAFQDWCAEWGRAALSILRPGGFLVAFGGTRTYHRMVCGLEDAGFVIQDTIAWMYGTGFPKNKAHLKPAFEPIVLAYKPGGKRTMQVDECRISTGDKLGGGGNTTPMPEGWDRPYRHDPTAIEFNKRRTAERIANAEALGRWPANVCHDGSDEVVACFPESAAQGSGEQKISGGAGLGFFNGGAQKYNIGTRDFGDSGSAARFFFSAKAGTQDRWGSRHPTVKPADLIAWLARLVTPPGGTFLDPFAGSGTAAVAALKTGRNAILIEREAAYVADIRERIAFYQGGGQHSVQAKHRNRKVDHGPLFAPAPLTPEEDAADSLASYNAAMAAIGERVKAGMPVPEFMRSVKKI